MLGDYAEAIRVLEKTLATAETLGLRSIVGWAKHHCGLAVHRLGDAARALQLEDEASVIARELEDVQLGIATLQYRSLIEREAGHAESALASADSALSASLRHHARSAETLCRTLRAQALVDLENYEEALEECNRVRDARADVPLLLARRDALVQLGRHEEAEEALDEAKHHLQTLLAHVDSEHLRNTCATQVPAHARLAAL